MANGAAVTGLFLLLGACGSRTDLDARALEVSIGATAGTTNGSAGSSGFAGASVAGSSNSGGTSGAAPPECTFEAVPQPNVGLSGSSLPPDTTPGVVLQVNANGLQLQSARGGTHFFGWRGPSLVERFTVGEAVELVSAPSGGSGPPWSVVTSQTVTVATWGGTWTVGLSATPGAKAPFAPPPQLPGLEWTNAGCCLAQQQLVCDYSALTANVGGLSARIAEGSTTALGDWQISNLGAIDADFGLSLAVTMMGPATSVR